jgi:hypothetical protein
MDTRAEPCGGDHKRMGSLLSHKHFKHEIYDLLYYRGAMNG